MPFRPWVEMVANQSGPMTVYEWVALANLFA
jgi:hypothetical protein